MLLQFYFSPPQNNHASLLFHVDIDLIDSIVLKLFLPLNSAVVDERGMTVITAFLDTVTSLV